MHMLQGLEVAAAVSDGRSSGVPRTMVAELTGKRRLVMGGG